MSKELTETAEQGNSAAELLGRIGQLTRQLHEGLRELGLDKQVADAAQAIPDARERLNYIATMTEQAAHRTLNAIELAQPIQEGLARDAKGLSQRWDEWFASPIEMDQARQLVSGTRGYLLDVPQKTAAINTQLMEVMMAQDFQDLTGQVIKKMMEVFHDVETKLLQVLIDNSPIEKQQEISQGLQNGPQIKPGNPEAVTDQTQVDDLLESLGF